MFTPHDIQRIWNGVKSCDYTGEKATTDMERYLDFVLTIANAYLAVKDDQKAMETALSDALLQDFGQKVNAQALKQEIIDNANYELKIDVTPLTVSAIEPVAGVPNPPPPSAPYVPSENDRRLAAWIGRLRTRQSTTRGLALVREALKMEGWFDWVASGPYGVGEALRLGERPLALGAPQQRRRLFDPISDQNDFQQWLSGARLNEPDRNSRMNCWEAILFAAYKAQLISLHLLQQRHDEATRAAKRLFRKAGQAHLVGGPRRSITREDLPSAKLQTEAIQAYYNVISRLFDIGSAVKARRREGSPLQPKQGDLVFYRGTGHVAISLGKRWETVFGQWRGRIHVMSLANYPAHFTEVQVQFFNPVGPPTYRPCPF